MNSQLTTEQNNRQEFVESFRQMALEKTGDGGLILDFLVSAMKGEFDDFKACHRLEAARLLEKFTGVQIHAFVNNLNLEPPTRRERRDSRRADTRISTEIAQLAQEKTDNGGLVIDFLIQAMQGELPDFKPNHRMSASKELLHCVFDFTEVGATGESPEPVETPEEREERLLHEEYERQLEEDIEYSLHGPVYYKVYSYPCSCEDRRHDCKGNALNEKNHKLITMGAPGGRHFLRSDDTLEQFKARYKAYLTRRNARYPHSPIHFENICWIAPINWTIPYEEP